jgi:hypothetical protein
MKERYEEETEALLAALFHSLQTVGSSGQRITSRREGTAVGGPKRGSANIVIHFRQLALSAVKASGFKGEGESSRRRSDDRLDSSFNSLNYTTVVRSREPYEFMSKIHVKDPHAVWSSPACR